MCSENQHFENLNVLASIEKKLDTLIKGRSPFSHTVGLSATSPYVLDYMNRKHLYMFSTAPLILTLESLGDYTIAQNTWTNIGFQEGLQVYAVGQATRVYVTVRATDEVTP